MRGFSFYYALKGCGAFTHQAPQPLAVLWLFMDPAAGMACC